MKRNPHIHTLVAKCTIDNTGNKRPYTYFNYESLRKSFMNQLLKRMYSYLKDNVSQKEASAFYDLKTKLYKDKDNGFYVHDLKLNVKSQNKLNV